MNLALVTGKRQTGMQSTAITPSLHCFIQDNHIRHQIEKKYEVQNQAEGTLTKTVEHGFLRQKFSCKIDKYALSAIKRAKSASCKDELANVACLINEDILFPKKLPRFCPTKGKMSLDAATPP